MNYYKFLTSYDSKVIGRVESQTIDALYPVDCPPDIFSRNLFLKKVADPEEIVTPIPIIQKRAKLTDLLSGVSATTVGQLMVSEKLKRVLTYDTEASLQFFKMPIIYQDQLREDYWLLCMYKDDMDCLDFSKTIVMFGKTNESKQIFFNNYDEYIDFFNAQSIPYLIDIPKIAILPDCNRYVLVIRFVFGGLVLYVSETIKKKMEMENITGVRLTNDDIVSQD